jgi:flagellar motor switch protein FliM
MEKVLNQEAIDKMVRAARGTAETATAPVIQPWDVLKAGNVRREQMQTLDQVHEGFARGLSNALSAYLRITVEATLVSAEYLPFGDFLQRFPEGSYLSSCKLSPLEAVAILEVDTSLALPIVDLLLGGQGQGEVTARETTDIEEQLLAGVMKILCSQLQVAWHALGVEFEFERRQPATEAQRLMNMEESAFSASFEVHVGTTQGTLNVAIPALASHALLRKLSAGWVQKGRRVSEETVQNMRVRLLRCPFDLELTVEDLTVPLRDLAEVTVGQLLVFRRSVQSAVSVLISGMRLFSAVPARKQNARAALITAANSASAGSGKDEL